MTTASGPDRALDGLLDDLEAEQTELDRVMSTITTEQWSAPTGSPGWDVRDQIIHLAFVEELAEMAASRAENFAAVVTEAASNTEQFEALQMARGRGLPGPDVLSWWRRARVAAMGALRSMEEDARLPWFGPSMGLRSFVTARLMETWAHGHDAAAAVGSTLPATPRLRHIAHLGVVTRGWSYAVRGQTPPDDGVRVELVAPGGDEVWSWGEPEAPSIIRGPARDFCLVVTQRCHWSEASLELAGSAAVEWMQIAQAFAGPPTQRPTRYISGDDT